MKDDLVIDRIRKARHSISAECRHDPKKLVEYYIKASGQTEVADIISGKQHNGPASSVHLMQKSKAFPGPIRPDHKGQFSHRPFLHPSVGRAFS